MRKLAVQIYESVSESMTLYGIAALNLKQERFHILAEQHHFVNQFFLSNELAKHTTPISLMIDCQLFVKKNSHTDASNLLGISCLE